MEDRSGSWDGASLRGLITDPIGLEAFELAWTFVDRRHGLRLLQPDISLFVSRTVFNSDLRGVLGLVRTPCVVVQTANDVSVPPSVAAYLKAHLGGPTALELLRVEGHLPHLSAPAYFVQVLHRSLTT